MTRDQRILDLIANGKEFVFDTTPPTGRPRDFKPNAEQRADLERTLNEWCACGVVERVTQADAASHYQLLFPAARKPNGRFRWCLDGREINLCIEKEKFKMETLQQVRTMIHKHDYLTSIDLRNAFFHVQMSNNARKHLGFIALGRRWRFRVLPFGTSDAPITFTRLMKPVMQELHRHGISASIYLDDMILIAPTYEASLTNTTAAVRLLQRLGFHINFEKSKLQPSTTLQHLGFELNTANNTIRLPYAKKRALARDAHKVEQAARNDNLTIRQLAALLGKMIASIDAIPQMKMRRHALQRDINYCLRRAHGEWSGRATISRTTRRELRWLQSPALNRANRAPLIVSPPDVTIITDAGPEGYGAILLHNGEHVNETFGHWSHAERKLTSNMKETLGIVNAIFSFQHTVRRATHLHIRTDNTTALSYLRREGGRQCDLARAMEPATRALHRWRTHLTTSHIPGVENGLADALSRRDTDRHNWALHPTAFAAIERQFGAIDMDWFADSTNAKHKRFASRRPDPRSSHVGAFRGDWRAHQHNYWCPPMPMIAKTLRKIEDEEAHGVIVVPRWLAQPWWPMLTSLMRAPPLLLNTIVDKPIVPSPAGHPMRDARDPPMLAVLV